MIQPWLLDLLVCPRCRQTVTLREDGVGLVCGECRVLYPVENGIPRMLPESARPLDGGEPRDAG